jgi:hypothetical protein
MLKKDGAGSLEVPFARRVRTIRMCSLDARGLGPIQATIFESASYTAAAALDSLFDHPGRYSPAVSDVTTSKVLACTHSFPQAPNHVSY